jgi:protein-disulfide isomerase
VLEKLCPLCIATHAAILLLFVITMLLWWQRASHAELRPHSGVPDPAPATAHHTSGGAVLTAVLLAATGSALGWFIYKAQLSEGYAQEYFARWQDYDQDTRLNYERFLAQPVVDIPIDPEDPVRGPADAKHTVIVFSDFMCPACQGMEITLLEPRREEFPGEFRIVFKHFPLDKTCNPELKSTLHPNACAGAVGVEAIRLLKGKEAFWTMHDAVFHNPRRFTTELAFKTAAELGIDRETYMKRVQTTSAWDHIKANVAEGRKLGLDSTPALYFDGRPLKPWGDRHLWKYLLSGEPLKASATRPASQPASGPDDHP